MFKTWCLLFTPFLSLYRLCDGLLQDVEIYLCALCVSNLSLLVSSHGSDIYFARKYQSFTFWNYLETEKVPMNIFNKKKTWVHFSNSPVCDFYCRKSQQQHYTRSIFFIFIIKSLQSINRLKTILSLSMRNHTFFFWKKKQQKKRLGGFLRTFFIFINMGP